MTLARNGDASRVAAALAALPQDSRRAVVLAYYRTLTVPALSHLLAANQSHVHDDLHRGVHDLLAALRAQPTSNRPGGTVVG